MQNAFIDCEEYGFVFDSANRLLKAKGQEYTYNAEDVRIRNKCSNYTDTYVYDTNCKLSRMLIRNTNGGIAKFVYGVGLIGEESYNTFKVYHFDSRGSTVALTDMTGAVIDTYRYDTYGKLLYRSGSDDTVLLYNGRDGVVFDQNGLYYMRARYYSPLFRRFVNADIIHGEISDSTSLNRYAYVNGNPVSFVDPFGLEAARGEYINSYMSKTDNELYKLLKSWGFSLTETAYETCDYANVLWGGFTMKLHVDISFQTPLDADVNSDLSIDSGYTTHESTTPELKLPWSDIKTKIGAYVDEDRSSVGISAYVIDGGWTYSTKHQIGLSSEANVLSISYQPDDELLPTVSISLDSEMHHLVKIAAAVVVVAAIYAPQALIAAAPTAIDFLQQLGSMTPSFA